MLSPDDATLVSREPDLPGLATALDAEAVLTLLQQRFPQQPIQAVEATYVRYKPETSCLVGYTVQLPTEQTWVSLHVHRSDDLGKVQKFRRRYTTPSVLGPGSLVIDELALGVLFFPNDRRLSALPMMTTPEQRQQLLKKLLPNQPALWTGEWLPLRYKPDRRYVTRICQGEQQVLLKFCNQEDYTNARRAAKVFSSQTNLRIPQRLGWSGSAGVIIIEWLQGDPFDQVLLRNQVNEAWGRQIGLALADLHSQRPSNVREYRWTAEAAEVEAASQAIGALLPDWQEPAQQLSAKLIKRLAEAKYRPRGIHGDFSSDQVLLLADGQIAFIDFDAAGCGDPMADLGSFLAQLEQMVCSGQLSRESVQQVSRGLISGYQSQAAVRFSEQRLRVHTAARLMRLVVGPFRAHQPQWIDLAVTTLQRAQEIADGR